MGFEDRLYDLPKSSTNRGMEAEIAHALRVTGVLVWLESRLPDKERLKDSTWS